MQLVTINNQRMQKRKVAQNFRHVPLLRMSVLVEDIEKVEPIVGTILIDSKTGHIFIADTERKWQQITTVKGDLLW